MLTDASTLRIEYWPILDGSKPAIEAAAVCNATGLTPAPEGLLYPPGSIDEIPTLMRPRSEGGVLHHKGQVEVISSLKRDGTPIRILRNTFGGVPFTAKLAMTPGSSA